MEKLNDFGYIDYAVANIRKVADEQADNIRKAAALMADAIANDKLINVYAGGGHTTLAMGEMFFRAGGLANINPLMETALSVFNQALKYLELERTENFGASIIKYYDIQKDPFTFQRCKLLESGGLERRQLWLCAVQVV
ncbi:MAG: SIS domain-containing protein [Lentisphaeria bacterium]|nr:SIS domain-containing protein [Lentisphaeria bacterium]